MEREERLAQLLRDGSDEVGVRIDAGALAVRARPNRSWAPLVALLVVVAAAVAVAVTRLPRRDAPLAARVSASPSVGSGDTGGYVDGGSPTTVPERSARADVPVLPHATEVDHSIGGLRPGTPPISTPFDQQDQLRWWTAPGTVEAALRYFRAHRPAGWMPAGSYVLPGEPQVHALVYLENGDTTIDLEIVAYRGGVAVQYDVTPDSAPTSPRPDWSRIDEPLGSVEVIVERTGRKAVRRTLRGQAAAELAARLEQLQVRTDPGPSCALDGPIWSDRAVFHLSGRDVTFSQDRYSCPHLTVSNGSETAELTGDIEPTILAAAGLPADYGR